METQEVNGNVKLTKSELAILILSATVTITLVSASSPLYPFNPWDDVNVFFVLGRGIKHGLVPYRDLFDHKGPLLHFIYALAALISETSFVGVWLIECLSASVFAIFSWKTVNLFIKPSKFAIAFIPVFTGITFTIKMFNFGGNTEELCFPLLTIAFYIGLKAIAQKNGLPENKDAVICGIIAGALFWVKYSFLGFVIGFCIYILIIAIKNKQFIKLWSLIWRFLTGVVIITIPILLYFLINKSLNNLWEAYFKVNLFMYHESSSSSCLLKIPVLKNIITPIIFISRTVAKSPSFGAMLLLSFTSLLFINKTYRKKVILLFALTFVLTSGLVFSKNSAIYYYAYILTYCFSLGLITLIKAWNTLLSLFKNNQKFIQSILSVFLLVLYCISILLCKNMYLIFQNKEILTQYQIANVINQTPNAKVLIYDSIDPGVFTAAGIMPSNKYFCYLNIEKDYLPILEEQDSLIDAGYFDFIITTYFYESKWNNYEFYSEVTGPFVGSDGEPILEGYKIYKRIS